LKQIYIDLSKAYDTLDRKTTISILEYYGVGKRTLTLLEKFWQHHHVIPRASGYHGRCFQAHRGVTQGDIISPMIFNVVVDCMITKWKQIPTHKNVEALFYADDGVFSSHNLEALIETVELFRKWFSQVGLQMNQKKTKAMICRSRHINLGMSAINYEHRMTGKGQNAKERGDNQVNCHICQRKLKTSSLARHLSTAHQSMCKPIQEIPPRLFDDPQKTYVLEVPNDGSTINCPIENCPGHATTRHNMRRHFAELHPIVNIVIKEEGPLTRCLQCKMFVSNATTHGKTKLCKGLQERRSNEEFIKQYTKDNQYNIKIGDEPIEKVESFQYLGRWMAINDSDEIAAINNVRKAQSKWKRLFPVLIREGARPKMMTPFYKAVVLSSLLYGSETWAITRRIYQIIESFHRTAARKIAKTTNQI
jgi:hypothetical protein